MAILGVFHDAYNYLFSRNVHRNENKPNLGEDLRLMMNSPEFEEQWRASFPFLVAGLTSWPMYWLYRGYAWQKSKGIEPLQLYINKTFYQAKMLEAGILIAAVLMFLKTSGQQNAAKKHEVQEVVNKK